MSVVSDRIRVHKIYLRRDYCQNNFFAVWLLILNTGAKIIFEDCDVKEIHEKNFIQTFNDPFVNTLIHFLTHPNVEKFITHLDDEFTLLKNKKQITDIPDCFKALKLVQIKPLNRSSTSITFNMLIFLQDHCPDIIQSS
jgi:hypothetical protein